VAATLGGRSLPVAERARAGMEVTRRGTPRPGGQDRRDHRAGRGRGLGAAVMAGEPIAGVRARPAQSPDVLAAEEVRELLRPPGRKTPSAPGRASRGRGTGTHAQPGRTCSTTASAPGTGRQIGLHLVARELIGRPPVAAGQAHDLPDVASCVRGENPRTVLSWIMRERSPVMNHLRQES
jgi:hypothetical protein